MLRGFILAMCLALGASPAAAQQMVRVYGPEDVPLAVPRPDATATVDSVAAQLNDALDNFDNTAIEVRNGAVRPGEEVAARNVGYQQTRRLGNDVARSGAFGGRVLLLPAGTPLYSRELVNSDAAMIHGTANARTMWCGAHEGKGYCLVERRGRWLSAEIRSDSPYFPIDLRAFLPVSAPQINEDPSAASELPPRYEAYRFDGVRGLTASISRTMRADDESFSIESLRASRFRLGSLMITVTPSGDGDSATVSTTPLRSADHQSELRGLARAIVGRYTN